MLCKISLLIKTKKVVKFHASRAAETSVIVGNNIWKGIDIERFELSSSGAELEEKYTKRYKKGFWGVHILFTNEIVYFSGCGLKWIWRVD